MTTYWFKPKQFGFGATPVTWQCWAVTLAGVIVVGGATALLTTLSAENPLFWAAVAVDAIAIAALVIVGRSKTDGDWRWRWGRDGN
jgi:hypothetical protein